MSEIALFSALAASARDLRAFVNAHGFTPCDDFSAVRAVHGLAATLISGAVATPETIFAVHRRTACSVYAHHERSALTGFLAFFALSPSGEAALEDGRFGGAALDPDWASAPSASSKLGYIWAFGGATRGARFAILRALRTMRADLFPHLVICARAATDDGRRLMAPLGLQPAGSSGYFYAPPLALPVLGEAP